MRDIKWFRPAAFALIVSIFVSGCLSPETSESPAWPDIRAAGGSAGADALSLDASVVTPMFDQKLLPIDLETTIKIATADSMDVKQARLQVEKTLGRYEATVGSAFPAIVPGALFRRVDGRNPNSNGDLFSVGFNTFEASVAVEWVINPGQVIYEIIAARKRLDASQSREKAVRQEVIRRSGVQYYDLVLAQARIAAARQAVKEAEELLRINQLREQTGTGILADKLRAEARLAERNQDLAIALNEMYKASLALCLTLQLDDPTVTLVPKADRLPPLRLIRKNIPIDELIGYAVLFRPDLKQARTLAEEAAAKRGANWWAGFGPQFELSYKYGGISGHANNIRRGGGIPGNLIVNPLSAAGTFSGNPVANGVIREGISRGSQRLDGNDDASFGFNQRTEARAGIGTRWSLAAFGDLKTASASEKQAAAEAEFAVRQVRVQVVEQMQDSRTQWQLIAMAKQQLAAAEEALRLTQANMKAGAMTTVDVLQSQDAVAQARLRHARAVVGFNQAEINLLASLGLLNIEQL